MSWFLRFRDLQNLKISRPVLPGTNFVDRPSPGSNPSDGDGHDPVQDPDCLQWGRAGVPSGKQARLAGIGGGSGPATRCRPRSDDSLDGGQHVGPRAGLDSAAVQSQPQMWMQPTAQPGLPWGSASLYLGAARTCIDLNSALSVRAEPRRKSQHLRPRPRHPSPTSEMPADVPGKGAGTGEGGGDPRVTEEGRTM